ncbi:MaoC family dehydratase [Actinocatenispora comari]|jgi:acyl dehydratase|uniref:Putative enoyl-CoA hydratase 1 n=1 Tax=Actinocatenispora comari TaxID=2807577 RepID=A0A8J4AET0_9ACTN|nr:MaoC family dehydratase [Actinocatenispora comari]GIL30016.1 putative enoyl-CoA hydratase 1 [Actinocatenispora comari]
MRTFDSAAELLAAAGTDLGTSGWRPVNQGRIDAFADATGDRQWIHVDAERAAAGPFGTTVAHGFLTLSLLPMLLREVVEVRAAHALNYGLDRVRFPAPLPAGSRVRASATLLSAVAVGPVEAGVQTTVRATVQADGAAKPCCVADLVTRYLF